MTFNEDLEAFTNVDLDNIEFDTLTDLNNIQVNVEDEPTDRIIDFIKDKNNPYFFKHKNIVVKCSFADSGTRLEELIERYLIQFLQK